MQLIMTVVQSRTQMHTFVTPSVKKHAEIVLNDIQTAIGLGVFELISGGGKYTLEMYAAFSQGLYEVTKLPDDSPSVEWIKEHTLMGMVRLLDILMNRPGIAVPESLKSRIKTQISALVETSYKYLEERATNYTTPSEHQSD
jgi:hypothetical protein